MATRNHLSVEGHLDSFQFGAALTEAAVNIQNVGLCEDSHFYLH